MIGVAIGDQILDVAAVAPFVDASAREAAAACASPHLNDLMALGPQAWSALRRALSRPLGGAPPRGRAGPVFLPRAPPRVFVPAPVRNFTGLLLPAPNAGKLFRPHNPRTPT